MHGIKRRASSFNSQRIDHIYEDPYAPDPQLFLHYGDLSDSSNLTRIIAEVAPDEVYNLGAQSHVAVSFEAPEYTADVDALGTLRLLEAIRFLGLERSCRFTRPRRPSWSRKRRSARPRHSTLAPLMRSPSSTRTGSRSITAKLTGFMRAAGSSSIMKAPAAARPLSRARSRAASPMSHSDCSPASSSAISTRCAIGVTRGIMSRCSG